ncbi:MAG: DUF2203 domain-containing protein [Acidobacteria bacterium]|nr:DUF2203 domain-containing protein [Acidobacteriota bacterium]
MSTRPSSSRRFTLKDAQLLLPAVRARTADAVEQARAVAERLDRLPNGHPDRERLLQALDRVIGDWTSAIQALGAEVKGLWLVDFDTGEGYYCWRYPEAAVQHYHGYEEGFAGRMKIV